MAELVWNLSHFQVWDIFGKGSLLRTKIYLTTASTWQFLLSWKLLSSLCSSAIFTPSPSGRNCRLSKCYDQPAAARNNVKSYLKSFGVYLFQWIKKNIIKKIFELSISVREYDCSIGDNANYNFWVNNVWH